MSSKC